ncbi:MAG: SH3 domain-containing protein [Thermomicrobiales bacterium]
MRSGPSLTSSVLLVIPTAATVILRGQESNGFVAVTYGGQDGWVFGTYLSIDEPAPPPTRTTVTTDDLNLRSGPGTANGVLTVIPRGQTVTITGQETGGFVPMTWDAYSGWVSTAYLSTGAAPVTPTPTAPPTRTATTTDDLNLRSGPGTSNGVVAVIPAGTAITVTGQASGGFVPVSWNGRTGWASQDYLRFASPTPAPTRTPTPTPPPQQTNAVAKDDVNFRSGPGTSYPVVVAISKGARLVLTGQHQAGFLSAAYEGRQGWVSAEWVTADGAVAVPVAYGITTDALNLRSGPDATRSVLAIVVCGEVVELTGQRSNGFRSVRYGNVTGWMFESYLEVLPDNPPAGAFAMAFDVTNTIVGPARGSVDRTLAYARRSGAQRMDEVERYVREIYRLAPAVGFDPGFLVVQSAHETGNWTSGWWIARLNPAGIGVTGDPYQNSISPTFANGTMAARAQIAHMHAEVFGLSRSLPAVLQGADPTYQAPFNAG